MIIYLTLFSWNCRASKVFSPLKEVALMIVFGSPFANPIFFLILVFILSFDAVFAGNWSAGR